MAVAIKGIISSFITVLVGAVLMGPLQATIVASGLTGVVATIVSLIPLMYGLTILMVSLKDIT